jgi:hypothetical protein
VLHSNVLRSAAIFKIKKREIVKNFARELWNSITRASDNKDTFGSKPNAVQALIGLALIWGQ